MIPSLLLSTLSTFATPVFISEVRATREAGHLRVEVRGESGIDPEAARTRIEGDRLLMVLGGTRVRADNRAWSLEDGEGEIRAHRHPNEIELDVPIVGNGCSGPVELEGTPTGLTALVGCDGPAPARAPRATTPTPAPIAATAAAKASEKAALNALVALPEDEPAPVVKAAAPEAKAAAAAKAPAAAPAMKAAASAPAPKAPAIEPAAPAATAPAKPLFLPPPSAEATEPAGGSSEPSAPRLRAFSLPAVVLAGLAIAAYVFARRRRVPKLKQIQIIETASLGPKRSLVVARVGEETLVLGTSEAGITLLKTSGEGFAAALPTAMAGAGVTAPIFALGRAPAAAAPPAETAPAALPVAMVAPQPSREMNAFGAARPSIRDAGEASLTAGTSDLSGAARAHAEEMAQPLMEALADIPEPAAPELDASTPPVVKGVAFRAIEGGLASLFGGGRGGSAGASGAGRATTARFDDILEDSLEDQELRRKLAAGLSARVR